MAIVVVACLGSWASRKYLQPHVMGLDGGLGGTCVEPPTARANSNSG